MSRYDERVSDSDKKSRMMFIRKLLRVLMSRWQLKMEKFDKLHE
jgi:hypothetical protein